MNFLNNLSMTVKLRLLIALAVIFLLALTVISTESKRADAMEHRIQQIQSIVESAHTVAGYFYEQQTSGVLSEQDAKLAFRGVIESIRYQGNEYLYVLDAGNGMSLAHPFLDPETEIGVPVDQLQNQALASLSSDLLAATRGRSETIYEYDWPKPGESVMQPKVAFLKNFGPWNMLIATGLYVEDIRSDFVSDLTRSTVIIVVLAIILLLVSIAITNSIVKPMNHMEATFVESVNHSDLTKRLGVSGKNEIGEISRAFNKLMEGFQESINAVKVTTEKLNSGGGQLKLSSEKTLDSSEKQHQQIQSVATSLNGMTASFEEVATASEMANEQAIQTDKNTREGQSMLEDFFHTISELVSEVQHIGESINSLQEETQSIGDIVNVINSIAEQTNLLALNAAIEAARAGEQGRGFAVVADEVKSLASKTQQSTEEIRGKVDSLNAGTAKASELMERGQGKAEASEEKVKEVQGGFNNIASSINELTAMINTIASATTEQSAVAEEINESINGINSNADIARDEARDINKLAENLADEASYLANIASKFST